jgi:hypothetical protein
VVLLLFALARSAAAQAPGRTEPASAPFLEKRVPDELATEGVVLSRHNLGLQVEQLADKWLVSLVDLTTGRVAASTRVDELPADREAAVAAMTHVVAELAAQVSGRPEPPAPPSAVPLAPPPAAPNDDRAERAQRDVAELTFKRRSIRFGERYQLVATGNTARLVRNWVAYRGDLDEELDPLDFYADVGRPDLGDSYTLRRHISIGSLVTAGLATALATYLVITAFDTGPETACAAVPLDQFEACLDAQTKARDDRRSTYLPPAIAASIGSAIALGVGIYLAIHPHPIDENEAKSLADVYNQQLRRRLGLPVVTRRPVLRDLKLTPYVAGNGTGIALSARF